MPMPPMTEERARQIVAAVEDALRDGFRASGHPSAREEAAKRIGIPNLARPLGRAKSLYGLEPDWALERAADPDTVLPADRIAELQQEVKNLRAALRDSQTEELTRKAVRKHIFGLRDTPAAPPKWLVKMPRKAAHVLGVPTLFLSDWHWGECVAPSEVDFANEFNLPIAQDRARRVTESAVRLLTQHLTGAEYPGIVVALGGDMVTGDIHEELTATNDAPIMPTVVDLFENLTAALSLLADTFGSVFVVAVTGNHGRNTRKIQAKQRYATNFDWLVYQLLEVRFRDDPRLTFHIPDASDAHYRIYGHRYLLTHGDQFRGGDGLIGPLGPVTRGRHKKQSRDASLQKSWDTMLCGHFHTLMQLPHLIVNGSLKGLDEYAFANNFSFERPAQACWITHPQHGITFQMPVYADEPKAAAGAEWVAVPRAAA